MRAALRVFFVGGLISYRALFFYITPGMYAASMLGSPFFQIVFFTYLGRYAGGEPASFFVIGNAVQVAAMAGLYGMMGGIAEERSFGTLHAVLATPANRAALFLGRALPYVVNGMIVSAFGFAAGWLLLGFSPSPTVLPALALVVLVTTASCTGLGMLVGSLGLRARDVLQLTSVLYFSMLLLCGVNVALGDLPGWMAAIGRVLPMTHGIDAARKIAAGRPLANVASLVWTEAAIALAYAVAAFALFRAFERLGRRDGVLERY